MLELALLEGFYVRFDGSKVQNDHEWRATKPIALVNDLFQPLFEKIKVELDELVNVNLGQLWVIEH